MNLYKRPEMELDPAKLPGQIINRPPESLYARSVAARRPGATLITLKPRPTNGPMFISDIVRRIADEEGVEVISATEYKPAHGGYPDYDPFNTVNS